MIVNINKRLALGLLAAICLNSPLIRAQDNNPSARLNLSFVGVDGDVLANIKKHVGLFVRLQDPSPVTKSERRRLKRHIAKEIQEAIQPFGYYLAKTSLVPTDSLAKLVYKIDLNEPVRIKKLSLNINGKTSQQLDFEEWLKNYSLKTGRILEQEKYTQDKKALLTRALRLGYFDAKFTRSEIVINEARAEADIFMGFTTGEQYSVSGVNISWESDSGDGKEAKQTIRQGLLDSLITIKQGQIFDADALVKTQRSLLATPYFSSVSVQAGELNSAVATLPINIVLTLRKRHAYSAEVGIGTDTGIRGGLGYENRRINSYGHNLSGRIGGSEIKRSVIINYQIPRARSTLDSLNYFAALEEELGDTRRFQSAKIGTELLRSWNGSLFKFGLTASRETFARLSNDALEIDQTTDLLMPSVRWEQTKADDLYFPTKGWRASATIRGTSKSAGSDIDLGQIILDAKRLFPLGDSRLKLRFKLAGSIIDAAANLPESLGFLAGGDESVRGYRFESVGVDRNGETTVGKNLVVGSIEYEHPIKNEFAMAVFFDAGDAFDSNIDFKQGAGVGLRWRLPFGAMRLDAASALSEEGNPFRIHFSFGTDL
ncbi:MAG: translocation and assembly module TamA [Arenicella sp.]|jgi:translocation and assembly module TamA